MTPQHIERYLTGDLDAESRQAVERQLAADPALRAQVDQRRQAKAAFLLDPRRRRFADLAAEAEQAAPRQQRWGWMALAAAAGVIAIGVVMLRPPSGDGIGAQVKGGVTVQLAVRRDGQVQPHRLGTPLHAGDQVRVSVDDPQGGYLTVFIEDAQTVDRLYDPDELGHLSPGRHTLPGSIELDDTAGRERLYVLLSPTPPDVTAWQAALETARRDAGFDHDWLPDAPARSTVIEYEKAPR